MYVLWNHIMSVSLFVPTIVAVDTSTLDPDLVTLASSPQDLDPPAVRLFASHATCLPSHPSEPLEINTTTNSKAQ